MSMLHRSRVVNAIRGILTLEMLASALTQNWPVGFIALTTLLLTMVPELVVRRFDVELPLSVIAAVTLFVFATIFLGEVRDFYNLIWWWDIALHGGSAMGFGLIGVIFVLMLFEGDRYAAPPWALALLAFCFAVTIGALWEIFEFAMDQVFGLNMQKSGLTDTMWDLIVDAVGAFVAAVFGFFYFIGRAVGGPAAVLSEFVRLNERFFRRFR